MRRPVLRLLAMLLLCMATQPARAAMRFWPFASDGDRLLEEAQLARQRLDFAQAITLLDEALAKDAHLEPAVLHERGLVARERGELEQALSLFKHAADLDRASPSRVDQAGVLVQLGRWPEAIVLLRQAFEERGTSLPAEAVSNDKRFVKLGLLKPYQELIETTRAEQAGPFGRVLLRLERLQSSVTAAETGLQRLVEWLALIRELATQEATAVVLLIFIGLFITFGVSQLGLFIPPWNLLVGMLSASLFWSWAARSVSEGSNYGMLTIGIGVGSVLGLWFIGHLVRWGWRRYIRRRPDGADPFTEEHLQDTLLLVDEVSRLGHRAMGSRKHEQRVLAEALRQAGETLRQRLDNGA